MDSASSPGATTAPCAFGTQALDSSFERFKDTPRLFTPWPSRATDRVSSPGTMTGTCASGTQALGSSFERFKVTRTLHGALPSRATGSASFRRDMGGQVLVWSATTGELVQDADALGNLAQHELGRPRLVNDATTVTVARTDEGSPVAGFTCDATIHESACLVSMDGSFVAVSDGSGILHFLQLVQRAAKAAVKQVRAV